MVPQFARVMGGWWAGDGCAAAPRGCGAGWRCGAGVLEGAAVVPLFARVTGVPRRGWGMWGWCA